jgi:pantothenate kinase
MRGVKQVFNQFIFEHDTVDKAQSDVEKELYKMLKLKYKNDSPLRPPRIIINGPPGSGRTTQTEALS